MALTDEYGWPIPEGNDDPAVPADLLALATAAEQTIKALEQRVAALESGVYTKAESDSRYAAAAHTHAQYSETSHHHDGTYQTPVTISTSGPSGGQDGDVWFKR